MNQETLIFAALAIGKQYPFIQKDRGGRVWEPHLDDGDAFRLAAKLNLDIRFNTGNDEQTTTAIAPSPVNPDSGEGWCFTEGWRGDKNSATRRAIVTAAAEIGKSMMVENHHTEDGCPIDPCQSIYVMYRGSTFTYDFGDLCAQGVQAGAWHESWNTSRPTHIEGYWILNDK